MIGLAPFCWDETNVSLGEGNGLINVQSLYWDKKPSYDRLEPAIHRRIEANPTLQVWGMTGEFLWHGFAQSIIFDFCKKCLRNKRLHVAQTTIAKAWHNRTVRLLLKEYNKYLALYLSQFTLNPAVDQSVELQLYKSRIETLHRIDHRVQDSYNLGEHCFGMADILYKPVLCSIVARLQAIGIQKWDPNGRSWTQKTKEGIENFKSFMDYQKSGNYNAEIAYSSDERIDSTQLGDGSLNSRLVKDYVQKLLISICDEKKEQYSVQLNNSSFLNTLAPPPPVVTDTPQLGLLLLNAKNDPKHPGFMLTINHNGDLQHKIVPREQTPVFFGGTDPNDPQYAWVYINGQTNCGSIQYCKREGEFMGECKQLMSHNVFGNQVLETVVTGYTYSNHYGSYTQIFYGYNELEQCLHERWVVLGGRIDFPKVPPLKNEAAVIDLFKKIKKMKNPLQEKAITMDAKKVGKRKRVTSITEVSKKVSKQKK